VKYFLLLTSLIAIHFSHAMELAISEKMKRGALIAIEGIDGSGKSTLAQHLYTALKEKYLYSNVLLTKEPGDTEAGKKIREIVVQAQEKPLNPVAEFLLFAADRAEHFDKVIKPALNTNSIIISDRLADSSLAYQGYGKGIDKDNIRKINRWAMQDITPDLTIFVNVPVEIAIERIQKRNEAFSVFEKAPFLKDVERGFKEMYSHFMNSTEFAQFNKTMQKILTDYGKRVNLTTFDGQDFEKIHGKYIRLMTVDGTEKEEDVARKTIIAVKQWIENHCT